MKKTRELANGISFSDEKYLVAVEGYQVSDGHHIITNNIIVNTRYGISYWRDLDTDGVNYTSGLKNSIIANNTISFTWLEPVYLPEGKHYNNDFVNNIIMPRSSQNSGLSAKLLLFTSTVTTGDTLTRFRNNLFYHPGSFAFNGIRYNNVSYGSILSWESANSTCYGNLYGDPQFTCADSLFNPGYFNLQYTSPAIDSGLNVLDSIDVPVKYHNYFQHDYTGKSRLDFTGTDIGAYEER